MEKAKWKSDSRSNSFCVIEASSFPLHMVRFLLPLSRTDPYQKMRIIFSLDPSVHIMYNEKKSKGESFMTIKELRQMKGLTLAAFAESIGIGMSTLTGYEAGKRQPSEKALAAIKEVYGVDLANTPSPSGDAPAPDEKKARKPRGKKEAPVSAEKKTEEKKTRKPRAKKEAAPTTVE